MSKDFKTAAAAGAGRFISIPEDKKNPPLEPPKNAYRLNLKLDRELKLYLADEAWINRLSITALVNQILTEYMEAHPHRE